MYTAPKTVNAFSSLNNLRPATIDIGMCRSGMSQVIRKISKAIVHPVRQQVLELVYTYEGVATTSCFFA